MWMRRSVPARTGSPRSSARAVRPAWRRRPARKPVRRRLRAARHARASRAAARAIAVADRWSGVGDAFEGDDVLGDHALDAAALNWNNLARRRHRDQSRRQGTYAEPAHTFVSGVLPTTAVGGVDRSTAIRQPCGSSHRRLARSPCKAHPAVLSLPCAARERVGGSMALKDGSPEDYHAAAIRHFHDARALRETGRLDNAGHLVGFAAECAIKYRIEALGVNHGSPAEHLPAILPAARKRLGERASYTSMYELLKGDVFSDWAVDHRYSRTGEGDSRAA